jgi:dihydropteroate synthase
LQFTAGPKLMGIVNVTPDSFSDGGKFFDAAAAISQAEQLAADGADVIDIGGESTRPGSKPVGLQQELDRVLPVVEAICRRVDIPISIDTSKAPVATAAIAAGAEIVNDITALAGDPEMLPLAVRTGVAVCAMHMQGTPTTMQANPHYENVVEEVTLFLQHTRDRLTAAGVSPTKICLDPGIGFGKTPQHNLDLLANCWGLHRLGCPVLVGHSRKSFLQRISKSPDTNSLAATIGVSCALSLQGVQLLRVHDVAAVRQALALFESVSAANMLMLASLERPSHSMQM